MKLIQISLVLCLKTVFCMDVDEIKLAIEFFSHKNVKFVCYFSCEDRHKNVQVVKKFTQMGVRTSVRRTDELSDENVERLLHQWTVGVGVVLDSSCDAAAVVLELASKHKLFDATHHWLIFATKNNEHNKTFEYIKQNYHNLNLSLDADIAVVSCNETDYKLIDVFNFGRIQGNGLEITSLGSWRADTGLDILQKGYKYYRRWDFHNLTLRAITVISEKPKQFYPELLSDSTYSINIKAFTKINSQLLNLLKELHNFRFKYTVADRWIGNPKRNSTLAVSNALYWGEQDISSTGARMFVQWMDWVDICFPHATAIETKFYYLMPDSGVGDYENRFLTPLSGGVWWCALAASALCAAVLAGAARLEDRPQPGLYAFFCVSAAICQQGFSDGVPQERSTNGRKLTLLVVGLTSMLLYNYYTSSVVSWLLSAAPSTYNSLEQLQDSNLELIFESVGYTRSWLDNPGFFYYSGYTNPKEDELRQKKVTRARRTVPILQPVNTGVELMRTGAYAYHTDPYTVSEAISRSFREEELCRLGELQMMPPAPLYIMVQKRSPYREFVEWSLLRLLERGHYAASRGRFPSARARCAGTRPRALALGQAAPAFFALLLAAGLAAAVLALEVLHYNYVLARRLKKCQIESARKILYE